MPPLPPDDLPEHVLRPIRLAHVSPALRALLAAVPRPLSLDADVPANAPPALRQLLKLGLQGGPPALGDIRLVDARARVALSTRGRRFEAAGDAIGQDAQALVRHALAALLEPAELAGIADGLAADASKLATVQHVVRAMLEASDADRAVHAMLTGITSGDCLAFHRAVLFVRDREGGAYVGSQAIGPRDAREAHRIWEHIEEERKSIDAIIADHATRLVDERLQLFARTLTLRPGEAADDEVAAAERADGGALSFRRASPVNAGLAALGAAQEFVLAALRPHGEVLGLIYVDDAFGNRPIGAERVRDLEFFVEQAALVCENFTLLERVASLAREDALTGLLNRRELEARFATEASRARRSGAPFGLLLVDMDARRARTWPRPRGGSGAWCARRASRSASGSRRGRRTARTRRGSSRSPTPTCTARSGRAGGARPWRGASPSGSTTEARRPRYPSPWTPPTRSSPSAATSRRSGTCSARR